MLVCLVFFFWIVAGILVCGYSLYSRIAVTQHDVIRETGRTQLGGLQHASKAIDESLDDLPAKVT
jgi:hypothetical protein